MPNPVRAVPQVIETACSIDECGKPARKAGLCWGHYKRKMRRQPVSTPLAERGGNARDRLMRAFERFMDAADRIGAEDPQTEYRRAEWRLDAAIQAYRRRSLARRR